MHENRLLHLISVFYGKIVSIGSNLQSAFLLYMRLVWGHQCFLAGLSKFSHMDQFHTFIASLNIPQHTFVAYFVASFELIGGICLFLGLMSRLMAIPVMLIMISALSLAHTLAFADFRFLFEPAVLVRQAPYPFLLTAMLVFIFGPGRISIDAWLKRWAEKQPKY